MVKRRRLSDSQVLYNAVIESSGETVRKLPKRLQRKFRTQLEGLQIPGRGKARKDFQTFFAAFTEKQINDSLDKSPEGLERTFASISRLTALCRKSSRPVRYMKFISCLGLTGHFIENMGFFAKGRAVTFQPVPEERRGKASEIIKLVKEGSEEAIRKLINILKERLQNNRSTDCNELTDLRNPILYDAHAAVAHLTGQVERVKEIFTTDYPEYSSEATWESEEDVLWEGCSAAEEALGGPEIYYLADEHKSVLQISRMFREGEIEVYVLDNPQNMSFLGKTEILKVVLTSESESIVQHELQHVFDNLTGARFTRYLPDLESLEVEREMRAHLASLAFMHDCSTTFRRILDDVLITGDRLVMGRKLDRHDKALWELSKKLSFMDKDAEESERIRNKAKAILNREYRKILGLTYDEILEPFQEDSS